MTSVGSGPSADNNINKQQKFCSLPKFRWSFKKPLWLTLLAQQWYFLVDIPIDRRWIECHSPLRHVYHTIIDKNTNVSVRRKYQFIALNVTHVTPHNKNIPSIVFQAIDKIKYIVKRI